MSLAADDDVVGEEFAIEDIWTGRYASGFGTVGGGRTFSFRVDDQMLYVEIYRPRIPGPVPQAEDVVATSTRRLAHVDVNDERSLAAAVRDAATAAQPVPRSAR
jgi:hypothetical protein